MAYQLKTTGIAAGCTFCLMVDPDTGTVKDFASAGVTADMAVGANVTIGSQIWDGNTRHYWQPGAGTVDADFIKFGVTKPRFECTSTPHPKVTMVFIGEAVGGGGVRVFGNNSSAYFAGINIGSGGSTHPTLYHTGAITGGIAALTSGLKVIFGFAIDRAVGATAYSALHDAVSMTQVSTGPPTGNFGYDLAYVNRRDDGTTHQRDKTHAILIFLDQELTVSDFDSLRDDWRGTMIEPAAGDTTAPVLSSPTGTQTGGTSATIGATTDEGNGTLYGYVSTSATPPSDADLKAGTGAVWSGSAAVSGTGANTLNATGLTASTGYYGHLLHTDAAANDSNTVTSAQFTTASGGASALSKIIQQMGL